MSGERWTLNAPIDVGWTPDEMAHIGNAVQGLQDALSRFTTFTEVEVNGLCVLLPPESAVRPFVPERQRVLKFEGLCPFCGREGCVGASAHGGG